MGWLQLGPDRLAKHRGARIFRHWSQTTVTFLLRGFLFECSGTEQCKRNAKQELMNSRKHAIYPKDMGASCWERVAEQNGSQGGHY